MVNGLLLLLVFLAANLPWFSNRFLYIIPMKSTEKNIGWCLFELIILYFIAGFLSRFAESSTFGQISPQGWEFYAVTSCLFLVLSFPGFVYKFLWR
jgi:Na+(H+)/acetate symporter ActP